MHVLALVIWSETPVTLCVTTAAFVSYPLLNVNICECATLIRFNKFCERDTILLPSVGLAQALPIDSYHYEQHYRGLPIYVPIATVI